MKLARVFASAATMAFAALGSGNAHAAQYMVSYTTILDLGGIAQFSGIFTTNDTANADGFFEVTGLTGSRDGFEVTLAAKDSIFGNDNLFKPTTNYFTDRGIAFSSDERLYNTYFSAPLGLRESGRGDITNFVVSSVTAAVPEPSTWAMMLVGFGGIGFAMRRRKSKITTKVAFA